MKSSAPKMNLEEVEIRCERAETVGSFVATRESQRDVIPLMNEVRRLNDEMAVNSDERRFFLRRGLERAVEVLREFNMNTAADRVQRELDEVRAFHAEIDKEGR